MRLTIEDVIQAISAVMANKGHTQQNITADMLLRDLQLDSLDIAEALIILEGKCGQELNVNSSQPLLRVQDLSQLNLRCNSERSHSC